MYSKKKEEKSMKKCIYCGCEIPDESVIDFCSSCGKKAFSEKMLNAIIENMTKAKERGDINQGNVCQNKEEP
ncbi:MAG: hypothetical protein ABIG37_01555 [Nanoarchaeota archaeon]|nr:hypothetical protein [Nanoarchaeota archaeon]